MLIRFLFDARWIIHGLRYISFGCSLDLRWKFIGLWFDVRWTFTGLSLDYRWILVSSRYVEVSSIMFLGR